VAHTVALVTILVVMGAPHLLAAFVQLQVGQAVLAAHQAHILWVAQAVLHELVIFQPQVAQAQMALIMAILH